MWAKYAFVASAAGAVALRYARRKFSSSIATVLPPGRNILCSSFNRTTIPLFSQLCTEIALNAEESIKSGPNNAFHNHNAAHLTAIFRLGGSLEQLLKVRQGGPPGGAGDDGKSANTLVINTDNWRAHMGGFGLFGLGVETRYWSYRRFFLEEISRVGPENALLTYFPDLTQGVAGDFYHAIIELG